MTFLNPGRAWAYVGAVIGGGVSVAANVAHSYVRPDHGWPNGGTGPEPGAVGFAIFWPAALLVAVEIFSRTTWRAGWRWSALRHGGLLPLAGVAAFVSYRHLSGLLTYYGEEPVTQYIGPLAVDGLMLLATSALLATARTEVVVAAEEEPRTSAEAAATPGMSTGPTDAATSTAAPGPSSAGASADRPAALVITDRADASDFERLAAMSAQYAGAPTEDLLSTFEEIAADLQQRGRTVNYKNVAPALRGRGHAAGRKKVDDLIAGHNTPKLHAVGAS